jgi:hypothetical protein
VASVDTAETVMDGGDTAVKSAAVEPTMEPTVKTTDVETTPMEPTTMPSASVSCVGEIRLAEDSRAQ